MEFHERIAALAAKVRQQGESIATEEATKNAFVMPFISTILGYDVFNPLEVIPEFTADHGVKRGEKVDYAVVKDGDIQILIECKKSAEPLKIQHASQLFRYFSVTKARIAILTNGVVYKFYTDLDAPNILDERPFLVLDLEDIDESVLPELRKLSKSEFELDSIINAAGELKYIGELKRVLAAQFRDPDSEWVKMLTGKVITGSYTQKVREQFTPLVEKAQKQFLNDQVNERLKQALGQQNYSPVSAGAVTSEPVATDDLEAAEAGLFETTIEEMEGFQIVRAIVCSEVKLDRVFQRDAKSYFAILLDDNNRKPIARLHFNRTQKYLGLFDADKVETRMPLESLDEIYDHAEALRATVRGYLPAQVDA